MYELEWRGQEEVEVGHAMVKPVGKLWQQGHHGGGRSVTAGTSLRMMMLSLLRAKE